MKRIAVYAVLFAALAEAIWAAGEIKTTHSLVAEKGFLSVQSSVPSQTVNMNGSSMADFVTTIGLTNSTYIAIPSSVGTPGFAMLRNLSTTNDLVVGLSTNDAWLIRMKAGEAAGPIRLATNVLYAVADYVSNAGMTNTSITAGLRIVVVSQ